MGLRALDTQNHRLRPQKKIQYVILNHARGCEQQDFSFLSDLNGIESLSLLIPKGTNFSTIQDINSLRKLHLSIDTKEEIDFSKLSQLKECGTNWWPGSKSILTCKTLRSVGFSYLKLKDYMDLSPLSNLESFSLNSSPINTLDWLESTTHLKKLDLAHCRNLIDFDIIGKCKNLEKLDIWACSKMNNINFVSMLKKFNFLSFGSNKEIQSLSPLKEMHALKTVNFPSSTNILDGVLHILTELPNIEKICFAPRRHSSHKYVVKNRWVKQHPDDVLLEEK